MKDQTHTLTYISKLLADNPEEARHEAFKYRRAVFWNDIVHMFEHLKGSVFTCRRCGQNESGWFNPFTLRWIGTTDICYDCHLALTKIKQEAIVNRWRHGLSARIDIVLQGCGVPQRYLKADTSMVRQEIIDIVQGVLQGGGLYVFGGPGSGKTYLAAAILKAYILTLRPQFRDCYSVAPIEPPYPLFAIVADMLLEIRQTFKTSELSQGDVHAKYCNCPLLVLDDFMAEKTSEWSVKTIYSIINRRYINNMPLIITSNYGLGEVEKHFNAVSEPAGTSIVSRISDMGKVIRFDGGSALWRSKGGRQ